MALAEQGGEIFSQRPAVPTPKSEASSEMIVVPTSLGDKSLMLTVVDPKQQVISVYHIDLPTGKIALKSVRKIQWDLQITDFNTENPLPQEIRSKLEQR
jgi:nitrogen fixation protein